MCTESTGIVEVDFDKAGEPPTLHMACDRKGIQRLSKIMRELAGGRIRRFDLHRLEFVKMRFAGRVCLEVMKPSRLADNVDVSMHSEGERFTINWRASLDEWLDDADRVEVLAKSAVLAFQYLASSYCAVEVKVSYSPLLEAPAVENGDSHHY